MKLNACQMVGLLATAGLVPGALASDLSSNLAQGTGGVETASSTRWLSASFATDASSHELTSVTLLLAETTAGSAAVYLYNDQGIEPDSLVATLTAPAIPSSLAETTFTASGVTLDADTTYWVVLAPASGEYDWAWSSSHDGTGDGFLGEWGSSDTDTSLWWTQDSYPLQFAVIVDESPDCPADIDGNGILNLDDVNIFAAAFVGGDLAADLDGNGTLNLDDVNAFAVSFAAGCL